MLKRNFIIIPLCFILIVSLSPIFASDNIDGDEDDIENDTIETSTTSQSITTDSFSSSSSNNNNEISTDLTSGTTEKTTVAPPDEFDQLMNEIESNLENNGSKKLIDRQDLKRLIQILKIDKTKWERLSKATNKLNILVDRINKNDGIIRPELIIDQFLPDPLPGRNIPVEKSDWLSSYSGMFTNVKIYGIRKIQIDSVRINVGKLDAKIKMSISDIYLDGDYTLDGSVSFVSINGEGNFRFNISGMNIEANGNLERNIETDQLEIGSIDLYLDADEVNLDLENFEVFGSETIAQTIISALSDIIFSSVKYTVTEKMSTKIQLLINRQLSKISLEKFLTTKKSQLLFDDIVETVAERIKHRIDPVPLPEFKKDIETKLLQILAINVSVHLDHGKLHGLTTFARMGDIFVTYHDEYAVIEAEVGFHNLTGEYRYKLDVIGRGPTGSASLAINKVTSYLRIRQHLKRGATPRLEQFRVDEIKYVWIELHGLGVWNHLLELIVNSISNVFRMSIADLITSTVSKVIQQSLDRSQFSLIP